MNNAEQILFCRELVNDYLCGRWQRINFIAANSPDLCVNVVGDIPIDEKIYLPLVESQKGLIYSQAQITQISDFVLFKYMYTSFSILPL